MEKNINIIKSKDNTLEMNIEIDGINPVEKRCIFNIKLDKFNMSFNCTNIKDDLWSVVIPNLKELNKNSYDFNIQMIVDGYYFEPYSGTLSIVDNTDATVNKIINKTIKEPKSEIKKVEKLKEPILEPKTEKTNKNLDEIGAVVSNIISNTKPLNLESIKARNQSKKLNKEFLKSKNQNTSPMIEKTNKIIKEKERRSKGLDLEKQKQIMNILNDS